MILRRLLGPKNSLILPFHGADDLDRDELEARLDHVSTYYRFAKLSEVTEGLAKKELGLASVVFLSASKGLMLRVLPELESRRIPVTVFADTDIVGSNRLSVEDEVAAYRTHNSAAAADSELETIYSAWKNKKLETSALLARLRAHGPFPVEKLNPLHFSVTWGKITEIPASLREVGIAFSQSVSEEELPSRLTFVAQRTGTPVTAAWNAHFAPSVESLFAKGIRAVVGQKTGIVEQGTSPTDLPLFAFESA